MNTLALIESQNKGNLFHCKGVTLPLCLLAILSIVKEGWNIVQTIVHAKIYSQMKQI